MSLREIGRKSIWSHRYHHIGFLDVETTVFGGRKYVRGNEVVYSSKENNRFTYTSFAGFLRVSRADRQIRGQAGEVLPYSLFGTMGHNRPDAPPGTTSWAGLLQNAFKSESNRVYNPDRGRGAQSSPIDMQRLAEESKQLFESPVVFMNFEPSGGSISLAELRMAILASSLTGHKLIIRMEKANNDINVIRSRAIAQADIEFFTGKLPQANIDVIEAGESFKADIPEIMQRMRHALAEYRELSKKKLPLSEDRPTDAEGVVLSGSSATARDMAIRTETIKQLDAAGIGVQDTFNPLFDGGEPGNPNFEAMKQSRKKELETMYRAQEQLVYVGNESVSTFSQVTTAFLISAFTGSNVSVVMDRGIDRESYGPSTHRSHFAKAALSPKIYEAMKIGQLIADIEAFAIAPELSARIRVFTDGIQPAVTALASR